MNTILRLFKEGVFKDIPNPHRMIPSKGDNIVFEEVCYSISYLEFDYDTGTLFICVVT